MQRLSWVGVARAIPPDVRYGHPALRSLHASSLRHPASRSLARPARLARATPSPDPLSHKSPRARARGLRTYKPRARARGLREQRPPRLSLAVSNWYATSQSPSSRWGLLWPNAPRAEHAGRKPLRQAMRPRAASDRSRIHVSSVRSPSVIMEKPLLLRVSMPISVLSTIKATAGRPRGWTRIG